jgi:hypothetical protein
MSYLYDFCTTFRVRQKSDKKIVKIISLFSLILVDFRNFRQKVKQKSDKSRTKSRTYDFFALRHLYDFCTTFETRVRRTSDTLYEYECTTKKSDIKSQTPALRKIQPTSRRRSERFLFREAIWKGEGRTRAYIQLLFMNKATKVRIGYRKGTE